MLRESPLAYSVAARAAPHGVCSNRYFWTTGEEMVLREVYPLLGAAGTRAMLPRRTLSSIRIRAARMGLVAPRPVRKGRPRQLYEVTDAIDALLREQLPACTGLGMLEALSVECSRPTWWLRRRGAALGVAYGLCRPPDWTPQEEALLAEYSHLSLNTLRGKLRAIGSVRTENAIEVRLKKLQLSRVNHDVYSANEAGRLLGVAHKTVLRWINAEALRATRLPGSKSDAPRWQITRRALREWIAAHPVEVDLRRVDKYWFIDLAFSKGDKA